MYGFTDTNQSELHGVFILLHKMFRYLPLCIQLYETCLICHAGVWRDENVSLEYVKRDSTLPRVKCRKSIFKFVPISTKHRFDEND